MTDASLPTGRRPMRAFPTPLVWRPDARIHEEASTLLASVAGLDALNVKLRVHNGEVTLSGFVRESALRTRVESMARALRGVRNVRNDLLVAGELS
jgi:osmotically-inducible protein OsmY